MPDFEVAGPDGAKYQITAPDEAAALAAFSSFSGVSHETKPRSASNYIGNIADQTVEGLPVVGPLIKKGQAGVEALVGNAFRGDGPSDFGGRYNKIIEGDTKRTKEFATENPIASTTANIAGGILGTAPLVVAAPAAMGAVGTLPQMIAKGAASGAALGGADAAVRGEGVGTGAGIGGVLGAAGGPIGRGIGKAVEAVRGARAPAAAPVAANTMHVAGVDVPVPPTDVNAAAKIEMARKGNMGPEAQRLVEESDAATAAGIKQATDNIAGQLDPKLNPTVTTGLGPNAGRVGASADEAAGLVQRELQAAEQTRFQTEQARGQRVAAEGDQLRGDLAPDLYTGRPMNVADSPFAGAEGVGAGVERARDAAVARTRGLYDAVRDEPGTFDPSIPRGIAEDIRGRLNTGAEPLWVDPQTTSKANDALRLIDETVGNGLFRNAAAPRPAGGAPGSPGGAPVAPAAAAAPSEASAAFNQLVASGATPERARAAVANLPGAESLTPSNGALAPHSVATAAGRSVEVQPKVVEATSLRTSADPGYDSALQPRNRARAASDVQINDIAKNLNPNRLGASAEADRGAPIIGPDAMVESGNGRVLALRQAYGEGGPAAERYRAWLTSQGHDVSGMKNPVLVRERTTPLSAEDRQAFTREANQSSTLSLSAPERALADSKALSPETLGLIRNPGDLGAVENRDFVRQFMQGVPKAEQGALMTKAGDLSSEGLARVRNAVLAKAYGDSPALARIAESTSDDIRSISNGLTSAAPEWAQLRAAAAAGEVPKELDATAHLLDAVERTARLRARGTSLESGLAQKDAFGAQSPESESFMRLFYDADGRKAASGAKVGDALRDYAQQAAKVDASPGLGLGLPPVTTADILANVSAKVGAPKALAAEVAAGAREASAGRPPDGGAIEVSPELTLGQMDSARKRLVTMYSDARKAAMGPGGSGADERAMRRILHEFDNAIIDAFESGKFSGNSAEARRLLTEARASHSFYRQTFTNRGGKDPVGTSVEKILGRYADTAATPDQIAKLSYGSASDPGGGAATQVAQRLREIVGPTSPEWGGYKQGLFRLLDDPALSRTQRADRIDKYLTGTTGRIHAQTVLSAEERAGLANYAQNLREAEPVALSSLRGVDKIMAKISGRIDGIPSSNNEIIKFLYGSPKDAGGKSLSVALAQRLERDMTPEAFAKVKQGLLAHVMERPEGVAEWGPKVIAENLHKMRQSSLGLAMYKAGDLKEIKALADAIMAQVPPAGATNPSGSAHMGQRMMKGISSMFLPAMGLATHGPVGLLVGLAANKATPAIKNARAARDVKGLLYKPGSKAVIDPRFAIAGAAASGGLRQGQSGR